jgi:hypothetical protein
MVERLYRIYSFFYNLNYYFKILMLLLLLLITVAVATASVFIYYPAGITTSWVNPSVVLLDPGTSGVLVHLYEDDTAADVEVASLGCLVLVERNAFIYDDFSTNPLLGRLTVLGSSRPGASWDSVNQYLVFDATNSASGGYNLDHMIAYYSTPTPSGTDRVYLMVKTLRLSGANGLWKGLFLFQDVVQRNYYVFMFWDTPNTGISRIVSNGYVRLATSSASDYGIWYVQWGVRDRISPGNGYMEYKVYELDTQNIVSSLTATDDVHQGAPNYVGFGGALNRREVLAFDDFVACADANPQFVNVTGLEFGWTVYLRDNRGALVAQGTAGSDGVASLNVLTRPIVRNAHLEIRQGNIAILPAQSFSEVIGGDVYECRIKDTSIIGLQNQDSKDYNVYLRVENLQTPSGYSGSINLWVGSSATPIQIVGGSVVVGTSSTATLYSGATAFIHGTFSLTPPPSTPVVLTLSFHYYIPSSEVEVEYPITVRVHG